uniref:AB hydrolase-1 domain-containing protein n=1 Tax=Mucochytrium quahogii TaxID=96639 RepID=A0A7S2RAU4_9STRA|mmetsp:Transcript_12894/g.20859  ORF Transcript_12894/g.20859 Transcript_12894/m.20859 type:complete len:490 (-) Transcript_12894:1597-3066(-)|eukprot:CAMPEP_0203797754 /NCGR_PEP_ID=MMETSP0100_2-20121128/8819_1 /ASSEMBLY_ACC=CAM_ASM_000210 /TAXON_ID=96639 /ORGANISM=" , Strain NY0313808BC1" /LENGTH=489 /DNA_ID=CAMNT_0050703125 /DNA_START=244 /DNA_END=1713 /DNA_ORIENTATION=-
MGETVCDEKSVKERIKEIGGSALGVHDGRGVFLDAQHARARFSLRRLWLKIRLVVGLRPLLVTILRPVFVLAGAAWLAYTLARGRGALFKASLRGKLVVGVLLVDVLFWRQVLHIIRDPVYRQALFGHGDKQVKPGLHYRKTARNEQILKNCGYLKDHASYVAPFSLKYADLTTVLPALLYRKKPVRYMRCTLPSQNLQEPHGITLDFSFPTTQGDGTIMLLFAGVGGDSNEGYVRDTVRAANENGWTACVLVARGLGCSIPVDDVHNIFNPCDLSDVLESLNVLAGLARRVFLVGFSLGAISLCNLLGRHADDIPENVAGAVSISGGFKCDFMNWERYRKVYQALIVPKLLDSLMARYDLDGVFETAQLDHALRAENYMELYERLLGRLGKSQSPKSFAQWKRAQEGFDYRQDIKVPLLFFASCDDPLHHPDLMGVHSETQGNGVDNPNIIYLLTEEGGHIGWPAGPWPSDFSNVSGIISLFLSNCSE